MTIQKYICVQI